MLNHPILISQFVISSFQLLDYQREWISQFVISKIAFLVNLSEFPTSDKLLILVS